MPRFTSFEFNALYIGVQHQAADRCRQSVQTEKLLLVTGSASIDCKPMRAPESRMAKRQEQHHKAHNLHALKNLPLPSYASAPLSECQNWVGDYLERLIQQAQAESDDKSP